MISLIRFLVIKPIYDISYQIISQYYIYHFWNSDLFHHISCHQSYLSDLFHLILYQSNPYLYQDVLYFHHMLSFVLCFFLVPSILLISIFLRCQVIFFIILFSVHIFTYRIVQLVFVIIQHLGSLHLHQFLFINVIYNDRGNFEK